MRLESLIDDELQRRADVVFEDEIECDGCTRICYEDEMQPDPTENSTSLYCPDCMETE